VFRYTTHPFFRSSSRLPRPAWPGSSNGPGFRQSSEASSNRHLDMTELSSGHSRVAHGRLGFCSRCRGKTATDEVDAWRTWALALEQYGRELLVAEGRLSAILEAVSRLVERRRDRGNQ
jgi:hypothetical protein